MDDAAHSPYPESVSPTATRPPGASPDPGGWWIGGVAHREWQRFREEWAALPHPVWRRFLIDITGGLALCIALAIGLDLLGMRLAGGGVAFPGERALLQRILDELPLSPSNAIWIEIPGHFVFLVPMLVMAAWIAVRRGCPLRALALLASFFLLDLIVFVGWWLWSRPRPDLVLGGALTPGLNSFPSGHTAQTVSAWGLLIHFWIQASNRWLERVFAVLVLLSVIGMVVAGRLTLGAHWPSDIIAGALIGAAWLTVLILALRRAEHARR